jgi:hypothetical protein
MFIVPNNLPLFQWKFRVINKNAIIYDRNDDCIDQFESIPINSQISLSCVDKYWQRLLPPQLSTDLKVWLKEHLIADPNMKWDDIKKALLSKCGVSSEAAAASALSKLQGLKMLKTATIETHIDYFDRLRSKAKISEQTLFYEITLR